MTLLHITRDALSHLMPHVTLPRSITIKRGEQRFTVGEGGDLTWEEVENFKEPLSPEMLAAILKVKRIFPGSEIESG